MNDSPLKTFGVAFCLCVICSVLVSTAAILLKPIQERNKQLDRQRNILIAAGLLKPKEFAPASLIAERFAAIEPVVIDLKTGDIIKTDGTIADAYEESRDPTLSDALDKNDLAKIRRVAHRATIYLLKDRCGTTERYIFPIYGKGLWSTMHGFLALKSDLATVAGITFYDHGETPGLGGEIANPQWQQKWRNKRIFAERISSESAALPQLQIVRHGTPQPPQTAAYQVDGIAGATLTCNGVTNTIRFWLGQQGFGNYIADHRHAPRVVEEEKLPTEN